MIIFDTFSTFIGSIPRLWKIGEREQATSGKFDHASMF